MIASNLDFIKGFVSDTREGDEPDLIVKQVGSEVIVDPDNVEAKV